MSNKEEFTKEQMKFLELFHIAALFDCLYILDFHCMNEFNHDKVSDLTDQGRYHLAVLAEKEIFEHAIESGYQPPRPFKGDGDRDFVS